MADKEIEILLKPNWHPALSSLIGTIKGNYGYITAAGTVELLGPTVNENPNIDKYSVTSDTRGPTMSVNALGSFL